MKTLSFECPKKVKKAVALPLSHVPMTQAPQIIEAIKSYASKTQATITVGLTVFDKNGEGEISDKIKISRDTPPNILLILREILLSEQYADYPAEMKQEFLNDVQKDLTNSSSTVEPQVANQPLPIQKSKKTQVQSSVKIKFPWTMFLLIMANVIVLSAFVFFVGVVTKLVLFKGLAFIFPLLAVLIFITIRQVYKNKQKTQLSEISGKVGKDTNIQIKEYTNTSINKSTTQVSIPSVENSDFPPLPSPPVLDTLEKSETSIVDFPPESETSTTSLSFPKSPTVDEVRKQKPLNSELETESSNFEKKHVENEDTTVTRDMEENLKNQENGDIMPQYTSEVLTEELPDFSVQTKQENQALATNYFNFEGLSAKEWRTERLKQLEQHVMEAKRKDGEGIELKEKELDSIQIHSRADGVKAMMLIEEIANMRMTLEAKWK
jgi:hypothetical protein